MAVEQVPGKGPAISGLDRRRLWQGPVILSHGFRAFFLLAGLWAALAMVLWVLQLTGRLDLPLAFDPVTWHAHEFLFGYGTAVITGFLLTAVPNWTGRLPVTGWPVAVLVLFWLSGRVAMMLSGALPAPLVAAAVLAEPVAFAVLIGREIVAGKNWRNLGVLGLLSCLILADVLSLRQTLVEGAAFDGVGQRLGLAVIIQLIALIGGRIVPSFTRNWLVQRRITTLPVPPGRPDLAVLIAGGIAGMAFVLAPDRALTALLCALAGSAHLWRLSRWQGHRTGAEPLLWVLHAAYLMLGLGYLSVGAAAMGWLPIAMSQHLWLAGAVGLMTLAVMTRTSLGHTGRALHASAWVATTYGAVIVAVLARLAAGLLPGLPWLIDLAGLAWIAGFGGFAVLYYPVLARPAPGQKRPSRVPA